MEEIILQIGRLSIAVILTAIIGKGVSRLKLPSILGWLIGGMVFGPYVFHLIDKNLLQTDWYVTFIHILECAVGLMIGTELNWRKLRKSGRSILITTLTQSLGTFMLVSAVFGLVFLLAGIPLYLAFIFGGIALATAPAPALSIVQEFKTSGPVTGTLIPMAALDDIVGCGVFFTTIAIVSGHLSAGDIPVSLIIFTVTLPLLLGIVTGSMTGYVLKKTKSRKAHLRVLFLAILLTSAIGLAFNNHMLPKPLINFLLLGMAFSAMFTNMIDDNKLQELKEDFNPFLAVAMIIVILNLGAPLDFHLIMGAGLFTTIYIVSRALGKYFGAYFGASITNAPREVRKFLGLTLLPHSGVSLVFTGIAVSTLSGADIESARIIQGTIAAAAVINEIIAVVIAKKGFEWAGELHGNGQD